MLNQSQINNLIKLRHDIHQSPELSGVEYNTTTKIQNFLKDYSPDAIFDKLSGTALVAVYEGVDVNGPTILFRCELDALPILEKSNISYKSQFDNIAHSCGHDGHMAIICALAVSLSQKRPRCGKVILLFQPAEETGKGAKPLVEALKINKLVPDYSFALHNVPKFKTHQIAIKNGHFNCASVGMGIELFGKTSHASHPENGLSPVEAMCDILAEVKNINAEYSKHDAFCLISIAHAALGDGSFGITAGYAKIMLTLRSESDDLLRKMKNQIDVFVQKTSSKFNLGYDHYLDEPFDASINHPEAADKIRLACEHEGLDVEELNEAWRPSEDFGQFANISKSAMFLLGAGIERPFLHNPDFDFPDELIATGHQVFNRLIEDILG